MKRILQVAWRISIVAAVLLLAATAGAPFLLTSTVLPRLLKGQGLTEMAIEISQISPWRLSGTITLGRGQRPGAVLPFRLHYQLPQLLAGHLTALTVSGAIVHLHTDNGTLRIDGFNPPPANPPASDEDPLLPELPVAIDAISVIDSQLHLTDPSGRLYALNVNTSLASESRRTAAGRYLPGVIAGNIELTGTVAGSADFRLDHEGKITRLAVRGRLRPTADLPQFLPSGQVPAVFGEMEFDGNLRLESRTLREAKGIFRFPGLQVRHDAFLFGSYGTKVPSMSIEGTPEQLRFALHDFTAQSPYLAAFKLSGSFAPTSGQLDARAEVTAAHLSQPLDARLAGTVGTPAGALHLLLAGDSQQATLNGLRLDCGPYRLEGQLQMTGSSPSLSLAVRIDSLKLPDYALDLRDITGQLSRDLDPAAASPGSISLGAIRYRGEDLGQASADLTTTATGLDFSGQAVSQRTRSLQLHFSGNAAPDGSVKLAFTLPPATITQASLPRFAALPRDLAFSGRVEGSGTLERAAGTMQGTATIKLRDGRLEYGGSATQLSGIATEISFPFLPRMTSGGSQQLNIAAISLGSLKLSNGLIHFRIEDAENLFIEKSRFNWCGGKVESGSLRVSLADPALATTLYCDRLQFTELLSQLGIPGAEGDGSLNGRLPVVYTGKELVFDDGFLFSTPGNSGIVRFTNTAMLRQGLPEASQTAYLDYSMQAMENFSYNWTKLTFNSQGDNLRIVMQIDGKPAAPLPFGYSNGQLVPQQAGSGIQHPVQLDVNFNLPFSQMFTFGKNLQKKINR